MASKSCSGSKKKAPPAKGKTDKKLPPWLQKKQDQKKSGKKKTSGSK